jgi:hypothetical protein
VIATVIRDYDVAQGTAGFKELNERLSRELKAEIGVDAKRGISTVGVVLWPPHLAGSALWEFFILGKDGLGTEVSPDTPNALRQLYKPLRREMARYAKPRLPNDFPQPLIDRGFAYHGEIGWYIDDAVLAAEWFRGRGAAIIGTELWLVKNSVVQPHVQTESGILAYNYSTTTLPSETWEAFARRSSNEVTAFIRQFRWPGMRLNLSSKMCASVSIGFGRSGLRMTDLVSRNSTLPPQSFGVFRNCCNQCLQQ